DVKKACANCHMDQLAHLMEGAHAQAGEKDEAGRATPLDCGECHGGDTHLIYPAGDSRSPLFPAKRARTCANCHRDQLTALRKSVHAKAGERDELGRGTPMVCGSCHGENPHLLYPARDPRSPMFADKQVQTCGHCHEEDLNTYATTVHGNGLFESGLMVTAVCSSCHGAHGIYYAADVRSTLHPTNVATTCGKCHRFIEERLEKSVHGQGNGPGGPAERAAPGGKTKRKPSCTDCHQGHHMLRPGSVPFEQELSSLCGNCHPDLSSRYAMSLHGELTQLGHEPAAKCADCHGAHDILPVNDPRSPLAAGENRLATCRQCHLYAVRNFSDFDPHANHKDEENYPGLHFAYAGLDTLFSLFLAFFLVHGFLWFLRSFIDTLKRGRHKTLVTAQFALVRFETFDRLLYLILIVSFLGLTLTSIPLKYSSQSWAQSLARGLGGFSSTSVWHHFFAVLAIFGCGAHLAWGIGRIASLRQLNVAWKRILFGPDSPVPNVRDAKDLFGMGWWFFGLGRKPGFERWTYWEKFDYWAVYLAAIVIGTSGLILWFGNVVTLVLPGATLNVAKVIHSEVAIFAASLLFIFHFFHTHFRPEKFPMDLSALTGLVSEEHLRKARPEYIERLDREGKLEGIRRKAPSSKRLRIIRLVGLLAFLAGCGLLAVVLFANLGK
ncbi:MAG: hypothetical protein ABIP48_01660, partial [Planctomycetota bacterium]